MSAYPSGFVERLAVRGDGPGWKDWTCEEMPWGLHSKVKRVVQTVLCGLEPHLVASAQLGRPQ